MLRNIIMLWIFGLYSWFRFSLIVCSVVMFWSVSTATPVCICLRSLSSLISHSHCQIFAIVTSCFSLHSQFMYLVTVRFCYFLGFVFHKSGFTVFWFSLTFCYFFQNKPSLVFLYSLPDPCLHWGHSPLPAINPDKYII